MAAITMLLLWFFQFIFFHVLYYQRQEAHIKSVSANLLSEEYGARNPTQYAQFEKTAKEQNLNIYIFTFDLADIKNNAFPSDAKFDVYTPFYTNFNLTPDKIDWTVARKSEYLDCLLKMEGEDKSFTYIEENKDKNSTSDTLIYGGELKGNFGSNTETYFCLISAISKNNYSVTVFRNMLLSAMAIILGVSIILSLIFSKNLARPINKLADNAKELAKGEFGVNFENSSYRELQQLADSLNFAQEELSKTEQMRRDFIANVSHDLRTPLTMIRAYAEMIRDLSGGNEEKRTKHCQIIIDESDRLSLLVSDINSLSKLQSGTETFEMSSFDLVQLCKTVVGRFEIMSELQGYVFNLDCDDNAMCFGDYRKIEQVLYNLIGNSINYTGDDKVVTVRCKKIEEGCKVEIVDSGKGIAPEDIDKVWERYYRANEKKRNIVGSGLGLNIVKIILEGHKAKYGVDSVPGSGTTFWFILPYSEE